MIAPLLIGLLLGTITGGFALNQKQQVTHAVREGARYAATISPTQAFTTGTWAENVRTLVVERSAGDLVASDVCVSLVQGSPGTVVSPSSTYSTSGAPCIANQTYPVTANDSGLRVQVTGERDFTIEFVLGSHSGTMEGKATAKSEGTL